MYLRQFTLEFVAYKLFRNRQGYVTPLSILLVRCNYSVFYTRLFQKLCDFRKQRGKSQCFIWNHLSTSSNMGSSISRGRKLNATKNGSNKNPAALVGFKKFSVSDLPKQKTEFVEDVVCKENEIEENGMKVVDLGTEGGKVLLIKQNGKICALGTKCSHYGAPLVNGHLGNGRIRCQWHGACFNIFNGDIEDFPGLDSLPCYEVKISDGNVTVRADKELLRANKRIKPFISTVQPSRATFLVVGGGPAGATCVENLRAQGFDGRIIFIMAEKYLPYDRIKLSKSLDIEVEKITLRSINFYQERNIEIKQSSKLYSLDPTNKIACLDTGESFTYDKIFLATGSSARQLKVSGCELKNIFVLRTADDAKEIKNALTSTSNVVILGTSFIGMEAAAYCANKAKSVVVVGRDVPFKPSFGAEIGNRILRLFQDNSVQFRLHQTIERFEGKDGKLTTVCLTDGTKLPADICLVGIGTVSNTCYLNSSGIELQSNGTVEVNEYLQTCFPDVFAGGDIAFAPVLGQKASIGHWGLASYHGHIAAFNMLGQKTLLKTVPFFWTVLFGKGFRYTGYTKTFDDVVIDGSLEDLKFVAFYCSSDNVVAVTTINRDPIAAKFAEMLYENKQLLKCNISEWLS